MSDPLARPTGATIPPAGWFPDPVRGTGWRWWDGAAWTSFTEQTFGTAAATSGKPRRRPWFSWPVACCAPLVLIGIVIGAATSPLAVAAAFVPAAIVLPVIRWFDRVEPEPRASRVHALLWGGAVAVLVAVVVNVSVGFVAGEIVAAVLSAPLIEEAMKGLGVYWAVRRGEVDGVSDGIVYAALVALGFAVVEDMTYFAAAANEDALLVTFVLRAILTPFAHPLFTFWIGLAIGLAVRAGRPVLPGALWGYALAVITHMAWNGSLAVADEVSADDESLAALVVLGVAALFVLLFVSVAVAVVRMHRSEQRRFVARVPALVLRYNLGPDEAAVFASWRALLQARKQLPRSRRRSFDAVHGALARLVFLHERSGGVDPAKERVMLDQLHEARRVLRDGG